MKSMYQFRALCSSCYLPLSFHFLFVGFLKFVAISYIHYVVIKINMNATNVYCYVHWLCALVFESIDLLWLSFFDATNIKINNQQSTSKENLIYCSGKSISSAVIFFKTISWFWPSFELNITIKLPNEYEVHRTRTSKQAEAFFQLFCEK